MDNLRSIQSIGNNDNQSSIDNINQNIKQSQINSDENQQIENQEQYDIQTKITKCLTQNDLSKYNMQYQDYSFHNKQEINFKLKNNKLELPKQELFKNKSIDEENLKLIKHSSYHLLRHERSALNLGSYLQIKENKVINQNDNLIKTQTIKVKSDNKNNMSKKSQMKSTSNKQFQQNSEIIQEQKSENEMQDLFDFSQSITQKQFQQFHNSLKDQNSFSFQAQMNQFNSEIKNQMGRGRRKFSNDTAFYKRKTSDDYDQSSSSSDEEDTYQFQVIETQPNISQDQLNDFIEQIILEENQHYADNSNDSDSSCSVQDTQIENPDFVKKLCDDKQQEIIECQLKQQQSIVILDWDDTLFCTSAFHPQDENDFYRIKMFHNDICKILDNHVAALLNQALQSGQPVIITNARKSWVYVSCEQLLPNSYQLIKDHIIVISAREEHEDTHPLEVEQWKQKAFIQLKENSRINLQSNLITNLIVIGDSMFEIQAGHALSQSIDKCLIKTVKLDEQPKSKELIKQLVIINEKWNYIVKSVKNLEIYLKKNKNIIKLEEVKHKIMIKT